MNNTPVLPAPELTPSGSRQSKWETERRAFLRLQPALLPQYSGKYVAIHQERVVDEGDDQVDVALRAYRQHGYVPIFVGLVTDEPQAPVRIPSPRIVQG